MIYLARHGQTEFNAAGRLQGHLDSPLTAKGRAQAQAMGRALAAKIGSAPCRIIASPLGRTQATAQIIAWAIAETQPGAPEISLDPRLMEIGMGQWDGLTSLEIELDWPGMRDGLAPGEWYFYGPGGETYAAFSSRLGAALSALSDDPTPHKIVVAHGVTSRVLRGLHVGLPWQESLQLDAPQDRLFLLAPQCAIEPLDCPVP